MKCEQCGARSSQRYCSVECHDAGQVRKVLGRDLVQMEKWAIAVKGRPGKFLCGTSSDWGPQALPGPLTDPHLLMFSDRAGARLYIKHDSNWSDDPGDLIPTKLHMTLEVA